MNPFQRFEPPDYRIRRIIGAGFLNVVCRRAPSDATDIWIQVHHTGADGAPMQEFLTRLEIAWGKEAGILFPTDTGFPPKVLPCFASPEERPLHLITDFIDFSLGGDLLAFAIYLAVARSRDNETTVKNNKKARQSAPV